MEWSSTNIILSTLFVTTGATLQAVTGLGAGLIIVPLLAIISVELIPGPMIFGSMALSGVMAFSGRNSIDYSNMRVLLTGLLLGTIAAASYISQISIDKLGFVFGVLILCAVVLSIRSPVFTMTTKSSLMAGTLSGFMGASAGIGAPILALLYQNHSGQSLRATLAFLYLASAFIMLILLNIAGRFGVNEIVSGLYLIPGFVIGYLISPKLVELIDKGFARIMVLTISTLGAALLLWRSISALYS